MREIRLYCSNSLQLGEQVRLDYWAVSHIKVLRLQAGALLILFNGKGGEFVAQLQEVGRQHAIAKIINYSPRDVESPVKIHLGQVISRGEKMDLTLQKAVELGVSAITPLFSERCGVKLDNVRLDKKLAHWHRIIISACEQSGRNQLPILNAASAIESWLAQQQGLKFVLSPYAAQSISTVFQQQPKVQHISLLIGPEGGFTTDEVDNAQRAGFIELKLGPRILRTETAGLAAIAILQSYWGDFS